MSGPVVSVSEALTQHAIARYQERVANIPPAAVVAVLDTPAMRAALRFGARAVKLRSRHRVVIREGRIVTITPPARYLLSRHPDDQDGGVE